MTIMLLSLFVFGYLLVAFENAFEINKSGTALLLGVLCWSVYALFSSDSNVVSNLSHHLASISEIVFFLLGAMTIVELIDAHDGFEIITDFIKTKNKRYLLIIISLIAFILSAMLDNLTTAIVMATIVKKIIPDKKDKYFFIGIIVIACNAGGCFSPIGDVTSTMLWMANKLTATHMIIYLIIPSFVCLIVPLSIGLLNLKGHIESIHAQTNDNHISNTEKKLIFSLGLLTLLFVPVFKTITHLPPYMGILFGLGIMWIVTELLHKRKDTFEKGKLSVVSALTKTDVPSVLFFLGILLAVACLQEANILSNTAVYLNDKLGNTKMISICIGLLSAVVDNVPLLAATLGMYDFPLNDEFWLMVCYCTGTGGSCLIIGSAAGVAVMGIENMSFVWYLKNISFLALIGYLSGFMVFILQNIIFT